MDHDQPIGDRFHRATRAFARVLDRVDDAGWDQPTPCSEWDVRDLVAHVVDEHRWIAPLLAGRSIAEVAAELDDDVLGSDLRSAWARWSSESAAAVDALGDGDLIVHLSFGDTPASEYLAQLTTDHLVHSWDLARAIGGDQHLDAGLVAWVGAWFAAVEGDYRAAGMIGERPVVPTDASTRTQLLAMTGRVDDETAAAVSRFDEAFGRQDIDAVMAAMADGAVFESTSPPDGDRHVGAAAVRAAFEAFFASSSPGAFAAEELVVTGDRAVLRWRYTWDPDTDGHVRGIDLYTVRHGLVAEKLAYVKG
jgi:uncharacterized protein (TIGR03086 family)